MRCSAARRCCWPSINGIWCRQTESDTEKYRDEVNYRLVVSRLCADRVYLGGDRVTACARCSNRGRRGASLPAQGVDLGAQSSAAKNRPRAHAAACSQGEPVKFYYGTQTRTSPPTFTLFVNRPSARHGKLQKISSPSAARSSWAWTCADSAAICAPRREEKSAQALTEFTRHDRSPCYRFAARPTRLTRRFLGADGPRRSARAMIVSLVRAI